MIRANALFVLCALAGTLGAAQTQPTPRNSRQPFAPPSKAQLTKLLEERLSKVKELWGDTLGYINDPQYLWISGNRDRLLPLLIDCVLSEKPMKFPFSVPTPPNFAVGDLAFILLSDWGYLDFDRVTTKFIPQEALNSVGAFAYYEWVKGPGNRARLHEAIRSELADSKPSGSLPNHHLSSDGAASGPAGYPER